MCTFAVMGDDLQQPELFQVGDLFFLPFKGQFREYVQDKSLSRAEKQVSDGILVSSPITIPVILLQKWTRTSKTASRIEARR